MMSSDEVKEKVSEKRDFNEEIKLSTTTFESLEKDFQEVLQQLAGESHLEEFRIEYEKIHRALLKSHENEKRLMKKCAELNQEIVNNAEKVQRALTLSTQDTNTIFQLKKEIDKAWKMVEAAHEKEIKAKETIQALTKEISVLTKLVNHGVGVTVGQKDTVNDLMKVKEELTKERDQQQSQIVGLLNDNNNLQTTIKRINEEKKKLENEIALMKQDVTSRKLDFDKEIKKRDKAERELKDAQAKIEQKIIDLANRDVQLQQFESVVKDLQQKLIKEKKECDKANEESRQLQLTKENLQNQLKDLHDENFKLQDIQNNLQMTLKQKETTILNYRNKEAAKDRTNELLQKEKKQLEAEKYAIELSKEDIVLEKNELLKKIETLGKDLESSRSEIVELTHQRNLLAKNSVREKKDLEKQQSMLRIVEGHKKNMERKLQAYRKAAEEQRKEIYRLEKEREKYAAKSAEATQKYFQALEEVKIKTLEVNEMQKKIQEGTDKLKNQQALYEAVRSDRNMYSKNLVDAQEEIGEMQRKFKIMNQQIDQLKEEIAGRDKNLVDEQENKRKLEKQKDNMVVQIVKLKEQIKKQEKINKHHSDEITRLTQIIKEADNERKKQQKEFEAVVNDRDILGTQLIRRNDELALLYEKIKIQQSALNKGAAQYRAKIDDLRMLKLKIEELKRKLHILKNRTSETSNLSSEIHLLQKQLVQERTRNKALSEELENPMNVHRWRNLEGSDPTAYEMIQKIRTLQKNLTKKREEVMEKDLLLQEKEKLYIELKKILERKPGPEVAEQINAYQETLRKKNVQMKTMAAELNTYMFQVKELKYEIERIKKDLDDTKKKYYELKKKESSRNERTNTVQSFAITPAPNQTQFVGGGFNVNTTL